MPPRTLCPLNETSECKRVTRKGEDMYSFVSREEVEVRKGVGLRSAFLGRTEGRGMPIDVFLLDNMRLGNGIGSFSDFAILLIDRGHSRLVCGRTVSAVREV